MAQEAQSRAVFEQRLAEHAEKNPEFRKKLLQDPKGAVAELLGMDLPGDLKLVVHEEDESTLHFVLPPASGELNVSDLSGISGGLCWSDCDIFVPAR